MNDVFGRSMFSPKTAARDQLRKTGGIMSSSAPLMQSTIGYDIGGSVEAPKQEFVISVPGYRNGEALRVSESTLMMMNNLIPELMSSQGTQVIPADMVGRDIANIRPGDAIVSRDLIPAPQQQNPRPDLVSASEIPSAAGQLTGEYMAGMDQQMRDLLAAQSAPVLRSDTELGSGYRGPNPAQEQDALMQLLAQQGEESRQRVEGYDRQFINDANRGIPMPVQPTVVGSGEPSAQAQMAGLASDLSSPGDFREPSTMTAMERLMAEQNAVPPMLRDVPLADTQAQPEAAQPEMLMPPLSQQLQPDASFDLGSYLEAMYPNGDPTVLPDVQGPPTAPRAPEPPVSRKQTVLERRGLESMFGGPDLSNYTGERTTFSDATTNPADPTFETLDDNKAAIDELLKNKNLSNNERKALEAKRAGLEGLSLTNTFVKGFVKDTIGLDDNTKAALNDTLNRTNDALTDAGGLIVRATAPYVSVVSPELGAKLFDAGDFLAEFGQGPKPSDFNFGSEDLLMEQDTTAKTRGSFIKPPPPGEDILPVVKDNSKGTTTEVPPAVTPDAVIPDAVTPAPNENEEVFTPVVKPAPNVLTFGAEIGEVNQDTLISAGRMTAESLSMGDPDTAATTTLQGYGIDTEGLTLEQQTEAFAKVYGKILGETDKTKAMRNAMLFANIGFSIAAEGGPDALQNIARGFQAGTAQMSENMATDQARKDKIQMLAIEAAQTQEASRRSESIAKIKDINDFIQQKQLIEYRAQFDTTKTGKTVGVAPNPLEQLNSEAKAHMDSTGVDRQTAEEAVMAGVLGKYTKQQILDGAAKLLPLWEKLEAAAAKARKKVPLTAAQKTEQQAANAAAKAAGAPTFEYLGKTYNVK